MGHLTYCEHPRHRNSKKTLSRMLKRLPFRKQQGYQPTEEIVQPVDDSKLRQTDVFSFIEQGKELCPYGRNYTIIRETQKVYGTCALTDLPCPRHEVDPIDQQGCGHYNTIWGKRDLEQVATSPSS